MDDVDYDDTFNGQEKKSQFFDYHGNEVAGRPAAEKQQHIVFFNRPIIVYKTNPGYVGRYTIWFLSYLSVQMLAKPKTRIIVQYFSSVSYGQNVKESSKYHLQQNLMQRWFNYAVNQWPIL